MVTNDSSVTGSSRQVGPLGNNTTYYWRLRAKNTGGWSPFSATWAFTTSTTSSQTVALNATVSYPNRSDRSTFAPTDYRIIGIPGSSEAPLASLLHGTAGKDWEAYWDNGKASDYLVKYDGSSIFRFSTGCAFWLIKNGPWEIDTSVPAAGLNANQEAEIRLQSGWNLITNPFTSSIAWSSIQATNNVTEQLFSYNGSFSTSSTLDPYVGYYFYNATSLNVLRIPYSSLSSKMASTNENAIALQPGEWRVNVALVSGEYVDNVLWFGTSANAEHGWDRSDIHKPRAAFSLPSHYFLRPHWDSQHSAFASDLRPSPVEMERWEFSVLAPRRETIQLEFNNVETIPEEFEVYLLDPVRARVVNLRQQRSYSFWPAGERSTLTVLVGRQESVHTELASIVAPSEFSLGINYPNPFNPATTIPFELPERADLTLTVYNLLGQEVKSLFRGTLEQGRYWFTWNGLDNAGHTVPSGLYLYTLTTNNGLSYSRKMV
ncbi:MAG: FlgD immunoglobulin-like domain containing protein, partial [Bacteroidota bacterium]